MSDPTICPELSRVRIRQGLTTTYHMHTYLELKQYSQNWQKLANTYKNEKAPNHYSKKKKKILTIKVSPYTLINGNLYKLGLDDILRRCALKDEIQDIIQEAHSGAAGGHFSVETTIKKILQVGLWWPSINKDCKGRIPQCDACQRLG